MDGIVITGAIIFATIIVTIAITTTIGMFSFEGNSRKDPGAFMKISTPRGGTLLYGRLMRHGLLLLSLLLLGVLVTQPALAKNKNKASQGTVVKSVNVAANTVILTLREKRQGTKQTISYKIGPGAKISVDGNSCALKSVHKGMKVTGYTEGDKNVLVSLDVQS